MSERKNYLATFFDQHGLSRSDIPETQIILVGSNPLPAYIALHILEPKTAILIGSVGQSINIAEHIKDVMQSEDTDIIFHIHGLEEPNNYFEIESLMEKLGNENINFDNTGINYTGGTKMMAVHFYRILHAKGRLKRHSYLASYVSSKNQLILDGFSQGIDLKGQFNLSVENLLKMHNMSFLPNKQYTDMRVAPDMIQLSRVIFEDLKNSHHQAEREGREFQYHETIKEIIFDYKHVGAKNSEEHQDEIDDLLNLEIRDEWVQLLRVLKSKLGVTDQSVIHVKDLAQYFLKIQHKDGTILDRRSGKRIDVFKDFYDWWSALWQEHVVYDIFSREATSSGINVVDDKVQLLNSVEAIYANEVAIKDAKFELDIVFLRSHMPYVISCTTDATMHIVKSKLFEAQSRARIIGGDHAKFALVSFINAKNKETLNNTLKRLWYDFENYKVFGLDDFFADNFEQTLITWTLSN